MRECVCVCACVRERVCVCVYVCVCVLGVEGRNFYPPYSVITKFNNPLVVLLVV